MAKQGEPWEWRWNKQRPLGQGGQGHTFLVENSEDGSIGVLKTLRRPKAESDRRRMFQEVTNLRVLSSASCDVPVVIDDNTADYEDHRVPLYIVMEYAEGPTLQQFVEQRGKLPLGVAIEVARSLTKNLVVAHRENILHRDLKPANVIVTGEDPVSLQIVDFGLSFNRDETAPDGPTRAGEFIDNRFLSLPEGRAPGADQRDARSDITAVCGILFYCLTGEPPVVLRDAEERPPHKRADGDISGCTEDNRQLTELNGLFDRGFAVSIASRFQNLDELIERLGLVLEPGAEVPVVSLGDFAQETGKLLLERDRPTQLSVYRTHVAELMGFLERELRKHADKAAPFVLNRGNQVRPPRDTLNLGKETFGDQSFVISIGMQNSKLRGGVEYTCEAQGNECVIWRASVVELGDAFQEVAPWTVVYRFPGDMKPDIEICRKDLEASLVRVMQRIRDLTIGE